MLIGCICCHGPLDGANLCPMCDYSEILKKMDEELEERLRTLEERTSMTIEQELAVHAHFENIDGKTHEQSQLLRAAKEVIRKHAEQAERIVHPQPGDA